jgi:hypothetical protein
MKRLCNPASTLHSHPQLSSPRPPRLLSLLHRLGLTRSLALSVMRDIGGPDWPLGLITVAAPSTPVGVMSLIDAAATDPDAPTLWSDSSVRVQQLIFIAVKSVAPVVANAGAIYIVRKAAPGGSGNRTDSGATVAILTPGQTFVLATPALSMNSISPYRYFIDADNANDGCLVTAFVSA